MGTADAESARRRSVHMDLMLPLVLLLGALAVGAFWVITEGRTDARRAASEDAAFGARLGADAISDALDSGQLNVAQLAATPGLSAVFSSPEACQLSFAAVGPFTAGHLDLISPSGAVGCSSLPRSPAEETYAGEPWLGGDGPAVTAPVRDRRTGALVVVITAPIPGGGTAATFFDLGEAGISLGGGLGGRRGLEFVVTTADADTILTRSIDPDRWVGEPVTGTPLADASDEVERRDVAGTDRLYATSVVENVGWVVHAGADEEAALASVDRQADRELVILVVGLAVVLLAALIIRKRITQPIQRLSQQVRSAAGEGPSTRIDVAGPREVADLADGFNQLLTSVEQQLLALRASEARKASMLESSLDCIIVMDHEGRVVEFNEAAQETFGYDQADVIGQTLAELIIPPAARSEHRAGLARYLETGEGPLLGRRLEVMGMRSDGTEFPCELAVNRVDSSGDALFTAYLRDTTDRVLEEERRQGLERRLHQSQRLESLGQLAGGVAHDFNNLLQVIMSYTTFIARRAEGDESIREDVEQIRAATDRAVRLTRQLLIFSRRDAADPEVLDLNAVVADVHALLARAIGEHVQLSVSAGADLPAVLIDRGQLEQVLLNLAVNARDAMPEGGPLVIETTTVVLEDDAASERPRLSPGAYVRLSVSDAGSGMSAEVASHAFDPFFSTKSRDEGSGLGLATVYGIVAEAGGDVSIYSEEGHGTTIRVLLPVADEAVDDGDQPAPVDIHPGGDGEAVLVVEDEPATREATVRILRRAGYDAVAAGSPDDALALAEDREFALLVTDVVMPGMSGRTLAQRLVERRPATAILFMSGYTEGLLCAQGALEGGARLLEKPFTENVLLRAVRQALS